MVTPQEIKKHQLIENLDAYVKGWQGVNDIIIEAGQALDNLAAHLKWLRFDTTTGPMIGGLVILGIILLAVWFGFVVD